jgi:hypothetical protein
VLSKDLYTYPHTRIRTTPELIYVHKYFVLSKDLYTYPHTRIRTTPELIYVRVCGGGGY